MHDAVHFCTIYSHSAQIKSAYPASYRLALFQFDTAKIYTDFTQNPYGSDLGFLEYPRWTAIIAPVAAEASSVGILVEKLVQKGLLTRLDAESIKARIVYVFVRP